MPEGKFSHPLSEKEAAVYLSVSPSTLRRWRKANCGPRMFRFGGILRYRLEDLDAFLQDHLAPEN